MNPRTTLLLFITAVGPPAVLASLKPLNNIIQLPLHVPCIVSNNYTAIGSGLCVTKNTLFTYILAPIRPYVPAVLYTMVGCACRVKLRMTKGVFFFSPPLGLVSSRGLRAAIALSREGLARVRIRVKFRMTKGEVFFFSYRTAIRSGLTYIILGAIRTYLQY